jgi:hypothetical protein
LARRKETYQQNGKSISWSELSAELTGLKSKPGWEWFKEIDSQLLQQAIADCKKAFENFFQKRTGFPKFKKKHSSHQSFRIPQRVKLEGSRVYIPKIGWVAVRNLYPFDRYSPSEAGNHPQSMTSYCQFFKGNGSSPLTSTKIWKVIHFLGRSARRFNASIPQIIFWDWSQGFGQSSARVRKDENTPDH